MQGANVNKYLTMIKRRLPILNAQLAHFTHEFSEVAYRPTKGQEKPLYKQQVALAPASNHAIGCVALRCQRFYLIASQNRLAKNDHCLPFGAKCCLPKKV